MKKINKQTIELLKKLKNKGYKYIAIDPIDNSVYAYNKKPEFNGYIYYADNNAEVTRLTSRNITQFSLVNKIKNNISMLFGNYKFNILFNDKNIKLIKTLIKQYA